MPRTCTICTNRNRLEIERQFAAGKSSIRQIAANFKIGYKSLERHSKAHLVKDQTAAEVAVKEQINELKQIVEDLCLEVSDLKRTLILQTSSASKKQEIDEAPAAEIQQKGNPADLTIARKFPNNRPATLQPISPPKSASTDSSIKSQEKTRELEVENLSPREMLLRAIEKLRG